MWIITNDTLYYNPVLQYLIAFIYICINIDEILDVLVIFFKTGEIDHDVIDSSQVDGCEKSHITRGPANVLTVVPAPSHVNS